MSDVNASTPGIPEKAESLHAFFSGHLIITRISPDLVPGEQAVFEGEPALLGYGPWKLILTTAQNPTETFLVRQIEYIDAHTCRIETRDGSVFSVKKAPPKPDYASVGSLMNVAKSAVAGFVDRIKKIMGGS